MIKCELASIKYFHQAISAKQEKWRVKVILAIQVHYTALVKHTTKIVKYSVSAKKAL